MGVAGGNGFWVAVESYDGGSGGDEASVVVGGPFGVELPCGGGASSIDIVRRAVDVVGGAGPEVAIAAGSEKFRDEEASVMCSCKSSERTAGEPTD